MGEQLYLEPWKGVLGRSILHYSLGFLKVYGTFLNLNISFIIRGDLFDNWKSQLLAAEYYL